MTWTAEDGQLLAEQMLSALRTAVAHGLQPPLMGMVVAVSGAYLFFRYAGNDGKPPEVLCTTGPDTWVRPCALEVLDRHLKAARFRFDAGPDPEQPDILQPRLLS